MTLAKEQAEQETEYWKSHALQNQDKAAQVPILQKKIKDLEDRIAQEQEFKTNNNKPVDKLTSTNHSLHVQIQKLKEQIKAQRALVETHRTAEAAQADELRRVRKATAKTQKLLQQHLDRTEAALQRLEEENSVLVEKVELEAAKVERKLAVLDNKISKADKTKARTTASVVASVLKLLSDRQVTPTVQKSALKQLYEDCCASPISPKKPTTPTKQQKLRAKQKLDQNGFTAYTYLAGCTTAELEAAIPPKAQTSLKAQGAQDLADALYLHWSLIHCSELKSNLKLSKAQWSMLRNVLFKQYNPDGRYTGLFDDSSPLIDGSPHLAQIRFGLPPSAYKLNNFADLVAADYGLDEMLSGYVAAVDVQYKLDMDIRADVAAGFFQSVVDNHGATTLKSVLNETGLIVQFMFDAAGTVRQRKTTVLAFKIVNGSRDTHKPRYTHSVACSEGGDDWATLTVQLEEPLAEVNRIIQSGEVESDGVKHSCDFLAGADQAGVHSNFGMGGCKEVYACSFCLAPNDTYCQYDKTYAPRSLHHFDVYSHTVTGYCPACELHIVEKVTDPKTQIQIALPGDQPPTKLRKGWNKRHFNVRYGCATMIRIEPELWAICLLHLDLRFVGSLFSRTMLRHFDGSNLDEARAEELHAYLVKSHIPIGKIRQSSNTTDTYFRSCKNHSFSGPEAVILRSIWKDCLNIVFPPAEVAAASTQYKNRLRRYEDVWKIYAEEGGVWTTLNDLSIEKDAKAVKVEAISRKFADAYVLAFNDSPMLYMHLLLHHYPDQIRNLPIDPWFLQLQGLEHNNHIRKMIAKFMSNNHKPENQKMLEIDSYTRTDGTRVKSAQRWSGPCMSYVLMKQIILSEHITNLLVTPELVSHKMEVTRRIKLLSNKANLRRIHETQVQLALEKTTTEKKN